jgi:hypothetical protein
MEPNQDAPEVQETPEVAVETTETPEEVETLSPEEIADLKKKAEASSKNFERLKKAEAELKEAREKLKSSSTQTDALSTKEMLYLAKADIDAADVEEVLAYSRKMGVDITQAHKFYKPILAERAEERKTAAATLTRGPARGASKVNGADILAKMERTGELPDSDEAMTALFQERRARLLKKK